MAHGKLVWVRVGVGLAAWVAVAEGGKGVRDGVRLLVGTGVSDSYAGVHVALSVGTGLTRLCANVGVALLVGME